ncbi:MAG: potassium channel family protein [Actinomycetes bacterium]
MSPTDAVDAEDQPGADKLAAISVYFPSRRLGPGGALAVRAGVAIGCLLLATLVVYFTRAGYYDSQGGLGNITILDAFYFATVSLSTTGYGDIVPSTDAARLVNALIITPLRLIFLIVLVGSAIEVLTNRTRAEFREARWRKKVKDHTVVIGYGVKGRSAVKALMDNGVPASSIAVVGSEQSSVEEATAIGCVSFVGNARRSEVLSRARVDLASRVVIAANADDTAALITLNVRNLNANCTIVVAAREAQNVPLLRQSGADSVITTSEAAGRLMGISLVSPTAGHLMEDLLDPGQGLEVIERQVTRPEYGAPVGRLADEGELVLAIVHNGVVQRFDEVIERRLSEGDRIVVIRHSGADQST